ncbi:MAG: GNVR domain-containing protein [bacterium]|nr:GNVR domain-containing protein [bacterium]
MEDNNKIEMDPRHYIRVIVKRKKPVLLVTMAAVIIALIVNLRAPKLYEASVIFMIAANPTIKADLTSKIETYDMPTLSVATYSKLISNPFLAAKVIEELSKQDVSFSKLTPEELTDMIRLRDMPGTSLMDLTVRYVSRDGVIKIANTLASTFIEETGTLGDTKRTQQLFADKLVTWKNNLEKAEESLKKFNATSKLGILDSKVSSITYEIVSDENMLRSLAAAIKENEKLLVQIEEQLKEQQPKLVTNKSITDDQFLQQLGKDITKEQAEKLNGLKVSNEELNPVYMKLMQRKVDVILQIGDDKEKLAGYRESINSLKKELEASNKAFSAEKIQQEHLIREVDLSRDTYKLISQKNDELSISYTKDPGLVKIVREAYAAPFPVSPKVMKNTVIGGLVGLLLGAVIAVFIEYLSQNEKR